jgi:non-canonical purine NTP pyrophosphatase (RdgB/HAM1 family)
MKLLVATKNEGKKKEILELFKGLDYEVLTLNDVDNQDDVEEDGKTFFDNALKKAAYYYQKYNYITVSDDSGLMVEVLNGAPGVYSARYSGTHGDDLSHNLKLIQELKHIQNRKAKFVCVIVVYFGNDDFYHFYGEMKGTIIDSFRGLNGFGYDPIFEVEGLGKTSAELAPEEKNAISHRAQAIQKLIAFLKENQK